MWNERFREFTLGAVSVGIASGDLNGDGRPDIYAVSKTGPNGLFLQTENALVFENRAEEAGVVGTANWETGVTLVDIDNDGDLDIYLCVYDGPNQLYINDGRGKFVESAAAFGLDLHDASVMGAFADYDRDGDLDVYLQTNILDFAKSTKGSPDYLYRNDGDGVFADVTRESGIWGLTQGHTSIWWDYDHDGWPDLYVANDFETPDRFYRNNGDGTFSDRIEDLVPLTTLFSMGADLGDLNNDGWLDFMVADMEASSHYKDMTGMEERSRGIWESETAHLLTPQYPRNAIYLNSGINRFREAAYLFGVPGTDWTWSIKLRDFDNDSWLDLFVTNGMVRNLIDADLQDRQSTARTVEHRAAIVQRSPVLRERNFAFRNTGELEFEDVSSLWGLDQEGVAFGSTICDFDRDGDLDIAYVGMGQPVILCRNDIESKGNHLFLRLKGRESNRWGIGSEVRIESNRLTQVKQLTLARGIVSSDEPVLHFGLGETKSVDLLEVRWPSGKRQTLRHVKANQWLELEEAENGNSIAVAKPKALFRQSDNAGAEWPTHQRVDTGEFDRNPLLPRRLGVYGPKIAQGDLNGDGRADFYIGGSPGQSGTIVLSKSGEHGYEFRLLGMDLECDDTGVAIFDANGDGQEDLLVVSGGAARPGMEAYSDRLYLNQGDGTFKKADEEVWPKDEVSGGPVAVADFDGDGDCDVFVGSYTDPDRYPFAPPSRLLQNREGRFTDVSMQLAPRLEEVGMVTDAAWGDLDGSGGPELVLAVEWGSIVIMQRRNGVFVDVSASLGVDGQAGLWSSVEIVDINSDGQQDILVGNLGLNTKYRASDAVPLTLFAGDIDGRGRHAIVEAHYEDGRLLPMRGRSKLNYSFPWILRKFPTFDAFAKADLTEIFGTEKLSQVARFEVNELRSGAWISNAKGGYTFSPFPREAQLAPTMAIVTGDWNEDGHVDAVLAQNFYGQEAATGRLTGSTGQVLLGNGDGRFSVMAPIQSGLLLPGDHRDLILADLDNDESPELIATENGGPIRIHILDK